ncbi:MrpF/PhaF family protein [Streptomyces sp. WAC04114]|uniref:MrpF/PhaF family protein n=1 Tax=Streptomyces sp. WAC04114 TaxID=2867961 RepID=UPI0027E1E96D|nr:MrpF/PhaF family protein [Streptomyces sp. WAC04114]
MNGWILTATPTLGAGPDAAMRGIATGPLRRRVVAQHHSTAVACPGLLLLAQRYGRRTFYVDPALVPALLGPVGTLVFARLLARETRALDPARDPARPRRRSPSRPRPSPGGHLAAGGTRPARGPREPISSRTRLAPP